MLKGIVAIFLSLIIVGQPYYFDQLGSYKAPAPESIWFVEDIPTEGDVNNGITAIIEFEYQSNNISEFRASFSKDKKVNSSIKQAMRQNNTAYYSVLNQYHIDVLGVSFTDIEISSYSPFIFVRFENLSSYNNSRLDLVDLSKRYGVRSIYVCESFETVSTTTTRNPENSYNIMSWEKARDMIGADMSDYYGEGIRIGFIEDGHAVNASANSNNDDDNAITVTGDNFPTQIKGINPSGFTTYRDNDHATAVASIVGGTYGLAPMAELYFGGIYSPSNLEWLLDQGVDIINMSSFIERDSVSTSSYYMLNGFYLGMDAYIDFITWNNSVAFVCAAGNGDISSYTHHPGIALNSITVGSVDKNKNISFFSSFGVNSSLSNKIFKPTVVAPGEIEPLENITGINLGTSYAAPMVTGVLALLMDEFPILDSYPELATSAIINSVTSLPLQTDLWDEYAGAGLINYSTARDIIVNSRYAYDVFSSNTSDPLITVNATINANQKLRIALASSASPSITTYSEGNLNPIITSYQIKIYNSFGLVETHTTTSNLFICEISDQANISQQYTIEVYISGTKQSSSYEIVTLTYNPLRK